MNTQYEAIKKIVLEDLKNQAKQIATEPVAGWMGSGYLTKTQYNRELASRKKIKKGSKMLLEALKLLKY
jgi:hypothetical protein